MKAEKLSLLLVDKLERLMPVILAIELAHRIAGRSGIVAIILAGLGLWLGIDCLGDESFPGLAGVWLSFMFQFATYIRSYSSSSRNFASTV